MRYRKIILASIIIMVSFLFSGCWDKVELDRKALISSIAIDAGSDISKEKEFKSFKPDQPATAMDIKKIHVTLGMPDISKLGPDKGGTAEDVYISTDAYSLQDAVSKTTIKSSRDIKFSHVKLLILGSDLMIYPNTMKEVVDYLQREASLNRMALVVVVQGKAEDYIKYKPKMEKNIETYITGLMENSDGNDAVLTVTLSEFLKLLSENGNALLPALSMDKEQKELKILGVGIIKDYKLKGYLSPIETSNVELIKGKLKGAKKTIYIDGHPVDVYIDGVERKISMENNNGKLQFNIYVDIEGELKSSWVGEKVFSKDKLKYVEENFNKSIEKECESVIKITQQEYGVDPIEINEYVEKYHPKIWNEYKNNWPEIYKNSIINVSVKTSIRRIGVVQ